MRRECRTELLLDKGYQVHGIIRRSSSFNTGRLHHLYADQHERKILPMFLIPFAFLAYFPFLQVQTISICTMATCLIALTSSTLSPLSNPQKYTTLVHNRMSRSRSKWQNIQATSTASARCAFWMPSVLADWNATFVSIKPPPQSYTARSLRRHNPSRPPSTRARLMASQSSTLIGSRSTIERRTVCMRAMVSFSITKVQGVGERLLLARSRAPLRRSALGSSPVYILDI